MVKSARVLVSLLLLAGCSQRPKSYAIEEAIPLGPYRIAVEGTRAMSAGSRRLVTVEFRVEKTTSAPRPARFEFMQGVRLSLRDDRGKEYRGLPHPHMRGGLDLGTALQALNKPPKNEKEVDDLVARMGMDLDNWDALFPVPVSAHNFALCVDRVILPFVHSRVATVWIGR